MTAANNCYIETRNLKFRYRDGDELSFPDLCMDQGSHWLITGSSGSGKTTMLHLLAGLLKPNGGDVSIAGEQINRMSNASLDRFRGREIGIVFQTSHFVQSLTVSENLALARFLAKNKPDPERVKTLLSRLGLGEKENKKPHQLSVGEQQRAAIARAMANKPAVVLADEPTASLDDSNCKAMIDLLRSECEASGATLVIVTHDQRIKDLIPQVVQL